MITVLRVEEPYEGKGPYAFNPEPTDDPFDSGPETELEFITYQLNNLHVDGSHDPWQFVRWVDAEGVELGEGGTRGHFERGSRPWDHFLEPVAGFATRTDHDAWFGFKEYEIMGGWFELKEFQVPQDKIIYSEGQLIFDRAFAQYQETLISANS